jgi:hypothetical protein
MPGTASRRGISPTSGRSSGGWRAPCGAWWRAGARWRVACGAGAMTRIAAEVATQIVATDASETCLRLARQACPSPALSFQRADAFALSALPGDFEAGFACGFFHLVPRRRRAEFLAGFHGRLVPGARVFLCASLTRTVRAKRRLLPSSDGGDVLCNRQLEDGRSYVIVNNDFDQDELQRVFPPLARDLEVEVGDAWWWVSYSLAPGAPAP